MNSNEPGDFSDEKLTEATAQKEAWKKELNEEGLIDISSVNNLSREEFDELSAGRSITDTLSVTVDRFKGEVTYSYWWDNSGGLFYCYTSEYRITHPSPPSNRHKANLHFSFDSLQWWGNDSPDAMRQDGQWHSYSRGGWVGANKNARVYAEFTFDKYGYDPKANTSKRYIFS